MEVNIKTGDSLAKAFESMDFPDPEEPKSKEAPEGKEEQPEPEVPTSQAEEGGTEEKTSKTTEPSEEDPKEEDTDEEEGYSEEDLKEFGELASVFQRLHEQNLLDIPDEEIEPNDSTLASLISQTIENRTANKYKETIESLPDDVRELVQIGMEGGNPKDYFDRFQEKDYSSIELTKNTPDSTKASLVKEWMVGNGTPPEKAEKLISDYEKAALLDSQAEVALEALVGKQAQAKEAYKQQIEEHKQNQIKAKEEYINTINSTVKNLNEVAGTIVTSEHKKRLMSYITEVDPETGMTPFAQHLNYNPEATVKAAFMLLNNFDTKHAESKGAKKQTLRFRRKLNASDSPRGKTKEETQKHDIVAI